MNTCKTDINKKLLVPILQAFILCNIFIMIFSCTREDKYRRDYPRVATGVVANINEGGVTFNGSFLQAGNSEVIDHGFIFGTGFGFGLSANGNMYVGDNSCTEIFCLPHKLLPNIIAEEGVSIRAVKRVYGELTGNTTHTLEPFDIFQIAEGVSAGNREAAQKAFAILGEVAGNAIAICASLLDGIIVIGGGLTRAEKYFMPALLKEVRSHFSTITGEQVARVQSYVYNLQDEEEFLQFAKGEQQLLTVFGTQKEVIYDPKKRIGITVSKLGADVATSLGAYAFALRNIMKNTSQYNETNSIFSTRPHEKRNHLL